MAKVVSKKAQAKVQAPVAPVGSACGRGPCSGPGARAGGGHRAQEDRAQVEEPGHAGRGEGPVGSPAGPGGRARLRRDARAFGRCTTLTVAIAVSGLRWMAQT
jgi:hypothetical protein